LASEREGKFQSLVEFLKGTLVSVRNGLDAEYILFPRGDLELENPKDPPVKLE